MMNSYDDTRYPSHLDRSKSLRGDRQARSDVLEIEISDISLYGNLPKLGTNLWDDFFSVRVSVCNQLRTTGWALRSYKWNKTHRFKVDKSSKVAFNVDAFDMRQSRRIGIFEDTVERLLKCSGPIKRTVNLYGSQDQEIEINFRIAQIQSSIIDKLSISYIDLQDLPSVYHDTFRVQVAIDDTIWESPSKPSNQGRSRWTDGYDFPFQLDSRASLEIFATRWIHKNEPIAVVEGVVKEWLAAPNGVVRKTLESRGAKIQTEFKVTSSAFTAGDRHAEEAAGSMIEQNDILGTKQIDALDISAVILDIDRVPKFGTLSWDDRFFLEIYVANNGESQNIISQGQQGGRCLMWDTTFTFNISPTSRLVFRVLGYDGKNSEPIPIGIAIFDVDELLQQNNLIRRPLLSSAASVRIDGFPTLSFRAARAGAMPFTRSLGCFTQELSAAVNRTANVNGRPSQPGAYNINKDKRIIENAISQASKDTGGDEHLYPLLVKMSMFVSVAERLAKLHPYARIAYAILASGYEVIRENIAYEIDMIRLMRTMQDTYDLVMAVEALPYLYKQKNVLEAIVQQTIECAFFIRDYVDTRGSFTQVIKYSVLNVKAQIKAFESAFIDLQRSFQSYKAVSTQLTVLKILEDVRDLGAKADFRDMSYAIDAKCAASYAAHLPTDYAAPPTDLITSLQNWVVGDSKESERICVLYGPKESCSTIALLVGERFQFASRLGSSYCFRGGRQNDTRSYTNLFSTIARDLAGRNAQFKQNLWRVVGNDTSLRRTRMVRVQFEDFILAPSKDVVWNGPFLIIVDGLELGGDEAARKEVLSVLVDRGAELPRNLRFLITCQLEDDIYKAFRGQSHILRRQLGKAAMSHADNL